MGLSDLRGSLGDRSEGVGIVNREGGRATGGYLIEGAVMSLILLGPLRSSINISQHHGHLSTSSCPCWLRTASRNVEFSFPTLDTVLGQNAGNYNGPLKWYAGSER